MSYQAESVGARVRADLTTAMKERDAVATSTLRMLLAAVTTAEVAGDQAVELSDDEVVAVIQSEAKKRAEAASVYEENGRAELAAKERAELEVIERYLPAALSDAELEALVDEQIGLVAATGVTGPKAMGVVIKAVRERVGATADGARVASAVKSRLGS